MNQKGLGIFQQPAQAVIRRYTRRRRKRLWYDCASMGSPVGREIAFAPVTADVVGKRGGSSECDLTLIQGKLNDVDKTGSDSRDSDLSQGELQLAARNFSPDDTQSLVEPELLVRGYDRDVLG